MADLSGGGAPFGPNFFFDVMQFFGNFDKIGVSVPLLQGILDLPLQSTIHSRPCRVTVFGEEDGILD